MRSYILLLVSTLAASVIAAPASSYSVHEKRNSHTTSKWVKRDEQLDRRSIVPVNIALTQRNLENGHNFLMDVSDPQSSNYGQHWTPEKVRLKF
jgi:tripeptidyl-peptidase-1